MGYVYGLGNLGSSFLMDAVAIEEPVKTKRKRMYCTVHISYTASTVFTNIQMLHLYKDI